jgi:hypothetical protein
MDDEELNKGTNIDDIRDPHNNYTPLMSACINRRLEMVKYY